MITDRLIIRKYDWAVTILYECDCSNCLLIEHHLKSIGCPNYLIEEAKLIIDRCIYNTGLTYSNYKLRRSIIVINKASSIKQLLNTTVHELYHLVSLMDRALHINNEEECATLIGNLYSNISEYLRAIILQ